MERRIMTAKQVNSALRERNLSQHDVARAVGVSQGVVSEILRGWTPLDQERKERFERAISELGLATEVPTDPMEPVFEVPVGETSE